jgi:hypothetical protein
MLTANDGNHHHHNNKTKTTTTTFRYKIDKKLFHALTFAP